METQTRFSPLEAAPGLIYLGSKAKNYKQVVYASQIYGSFFLVNGTFITEPSSEEGYQTITTVEFELVNYKGLFNIGLEDVSFDEAKNCFHLHLEALSNATKKTVKNIKVDCNKDLYFIRELAEIKDALKKGVHDDEFFYRDGAYTARRIPHHTLEMDQAEDIVKCIEGTSSTTSSEKAGFAPGKRCMMSELKILI